MGKNTKPIRHVQGRQRRSRGRKARGVWTESGRMRKISEEKKKKKKGSVEMRQEFDWKKGV
jgi:hypothetical protein